MKTAIFLVKEYIYVKGNRIFTEEKYFSSWEKMTLAFEKYFFNNKKTNFFKFVNLKYLRKNKWSFHLNETEDFYESEYEIIKFPIDEDFNT